MTSNSSSQGFSRKECSVFHGLLYRTSPEDYSSNPQICEYHTEGTVGVLTVPSIKLRSRITDDPSPPKMKKTHRSWQKIQTFLPLRDEHLFGSHAAAVDNTTQQEKKAHSKVHALMKGRGARNTGAHTSRLNLLGKQEVRVALLCSSSTTPRF